MMEISVEQYNKMAERLTELEYELDKSVKVVRCKDCRHGQYDATHYFCSEHYHKVYADDFCSHGERQCNYFGERKEV